MCKCVKCKKEKEKKPLHVIELNILLLFPSLCVRMNRDVKQRLELDWSDKYQACDFDGRSGGFSNMSPDTRHHPSSATVQDQ